MPLVALADLPSAVSPTAVSELVSAVSLVAPADVSSVGLLGATADVSSVVSPAALTGFPSAVSFGWLEGTVESATGWFGLAIVWVYSFLIAVVLPLPSEVVLLAPLELGLPTWARYAIIVGVSGVGKAAGSVLAFYVGRAGAQSGPVIRALERSRFDVVAWSERKTVHLVRDYGYVGLAMALTVPGFPDTISIYAFSVLEQDYAKFAGATFVGSVGRLLVVLGAGTVALSI